MKTISRLLAFVLLAAPAAWAAEPVFEIHAVAKHPGPTTQKSLQAAREGGQPEKLFLEPEVLFDAAGLLSAEANTDSGGSSIHLVFSADGKKRFGEITTQYLHERLAILIDGEVRCAPVVQSPILGGDLVISGNFTADEAGKLAADLNAAVKAAAAAATPGNP
ncbi:MAG: hypothetical protein INR65_05515 [Gluconacetobacter diazotrophicus]|nr:hypothetical protein [Gluconacetobacter diazotrophicus]